MRTLALIMSTFLMVAVMAGVALPTAEAQVVPTPTLTVFVFGETVGGKQVFSPSQILIPQVPVHLVVTRGDSQGRMSSDELKRQLGN